MELREVLQFFPGAVVFVPVTGMHDASSSPPTTPHSRFEARTTLTDGLRISFASNIAWQLCKKEKLLMSR